MSLLRKCFLPPPHLSLHHPLNAHTHTHTIIIIAFVFSRTDESEQSRTPILQFISKCDRIARLLHQVVLKVVRIEGEDTPYELPQKPVAPSTQGSEEKKLELVLQHIVSQIDYIFNYMEDDIDLLYLYCDMVAVAEAKKPAPEQVSKKVLFVVERAKHVFANLQRLQLFVLVKHNGPDPSLVEDLIGLQQLFARGWITAEEHQARESETIENIVRAYATRGRFLEQKHKELTIRREKPIELPADLGDAPRQAVAKLRALLDQGFLEVIEYNARASQIIGKWQREQQEAKKREAEERQKREHQEQIEAARKQAEELEAKQAAEAAVAAAVAAAAAEIANKQQGAATGDEIRPSKPLPVAPGPVEANKCSPDASKSGSKPGSRSGSRIGGKPTTEPSAEPVMVRRTSSGTSPLPDALPRNTDPDAAMAKLAAALQEQAARKSVTAVTSQPVVGGAGSRPTTPLNVPGHSQSTTNLPTSNTASPSSLKSGSSLAVRAQAASMGAVAPGSPGEKRRTSLFARDKNTSSNSLGGAPHDRNSASGLSVSDMGSGGGSSPDTPVHQSAGSFGGGSSSNIPSSGGGGGGGTVFDDVSSLQLLAKARHDPDAYRVHMAEKKLGKTKKADNIQLKACIDKTFVTDGHSIMVRLGVVNQSKKSVNCVKFILQNASEQTVNEVEDATRDVVEGSDPVFPLIKGSWSGEIEYILPTAVVPGAYKFRVLLFYNTRFNIEVPISLHVLTRDAMWKQNPLQVFAVPIEEVQRREGTLIPHAIAGPIRAMCAHIDLMKTEGVFRLSGDLSKIMRMRDQLDNGKQLDFVALVGSGQQGAVHNVLGVLKMFVRFLPQPLLTEELYDPFVRAVQSTKGQDRAAKVAVYKPLCDRVPEGNRAVLATLCDFFNRFTVPFAEQNKMHHSNISVVFGPVFCWRPNLSPMEELSNASKVNAVVSELIQFADDVFPGMVQPLPGVPPREGGGAPAPRPASPRRSPMALLDKDTSSSSLIGSPYASPAPQRMASSSGIRSQQEPQSPASKRAVLLGSGRSPRRDESSGLIPIPDVATDPITKPGKPLPLIPRSAQLSRNENGGGGGDDEEEEASSDK